MSYGFNLSQISLDAFREILSHGYLIPSMRVLLKDLDQNFEKLKIQTISNMGELHLKLKTKKKAELLSEETGIDIDYMMILRRMVSSYIAKPRKLGDYPDITNELVDKLSDNGIKDSIELYDYFETLSYNQLGIDVDKFNTLNSLLEVSQLRYVSPLFATVLVRSGYDSIEKIAVGVSKELHKDIKETNNKYQIYKGNIGDSDAQFLIDDAKAYLLYNSKKNNRMNEVVLNS